MAPKSIPALKFFKDKPVVGSTRIGTSAFTKTESGPKSQKPIRINSPPNPGIFTPPKIPA